MAYPNRWLVPWFHLAMGATHCWAYMNDHGGINGIPVKVMWEDSGSMGPREISSHRRFRDGGVVAEERRFPGLSGRVEGQDRGY